MVDSTKRETQTNLHPDQTGSGGDRDTYAISKTYRYPIDLPPIAGRYAFLKEKGDLLGT